MKEETKEEEAQEEEKEKEEKPIDKMTVKELREIAHEIPGLTGISGMKKEELLEAIGKAEEEAKEKAKKERDEKEERGRSNMQVRADTRGLGGFS